ncbi:MAG: InlB B-repeat-containing protein, partial [Oscillospiraceae bacterium]|nr:InlB B-repeat-containing protein [Oscillospiraceae bacterium]
MKAKRLLSLLLSLALLLGCLGGTALAAGRGGTPGGGSGDAIWAAIEALEAELLPDGGSESDYAAILGEVLALVEARDDVRPGSISVFGDGFYFIPVGGNPNGWFPTDRSWELLPDAGEDVGTVEFYPGTEPSFPDEDRAELMGTNSGNFTTNRNVALLEPYYGIDANFSGYYRDPAKTIANYTGGSYALWSGTKVDIQVVADAIEDYGIVLIDSHGNSSKGLAPGSSTPIGTSYLCLTTRNKMQTEDYAEIGTYRKDGKTYTYYHAYDFTSHSKSCVAVDGIAISNHMQHQNPNGLIWFGECQTMKTDGLGAPMREMGAGVVFGWSQSVSFSGDESFSVDFLEQLAAGKTVAQAAYHAKYNQGWWDPLRLTSADKTALDTYDNYSIHYGNQSWKHLMEKLYPNLNTATATRRYEKSLEDRAHSDNTNPIKYWAFPVFMSRDDSYPVFGLDEPGHMQDVYSDWHLPKKGESVGGSSFEVYHILRQINLGQSLRIACQPVYVPGNDYSIDAVSLVYGEIPDGVSWTNRGRLTYPLLEGTPTKPGLSRPEFAIRYRRSSDGATKVVYQTLHIMVRKMPAVTGSMTATATLDGGEQRIYFKDPKPDGDAYYEVEKLSGTIPPGMEYIWGEVDHPRFWGTPTQHGSFTSVWRILYYGGKVCDYTVTVNVDPLDPVFVTQTVRMDSGTLAHTDLVIRVKGTDRAADVREIKLLASSSLPEGIELHFDRGDTKPWLSGTLRNAERGTHTTQLEATLNDGTPIAMELQFDLPWRVHFNLNGHGMMRWPTLWVTDGETIGEPTPTALDDMVFKGWYTDRACTDRFAFSTPITGDTELYAKWETRSVVEFVQADSDGAGRFQSRFQTLLPGARLESVLPALREGYTFRGWYLSYADMAVGRTVDFREPVYQKYMALYPQFVPELEDLTLSVPSSCAGAGSSFHVTASFEPWNAQPTLRWTSSAPDVATVDPDGTVHVSPDAEQGQYVEITADSGDHSASVWFQVLDQYPVCFSTGGQDEPIYINAVNADDIFNERFCDEFYRDPALKQYAGIFSFDAETKTLQILGDAEIDGLQLRNEGLNGLKIRIQGSVTWTMNWQEALYLMAETAICGGGSLTVSAGEPDEYGNYRAWAGISVQGSTRLRLEGVTVSCEGSSYALYGSGIFGTVGGARLQLRSADLDARSLIDPDSVAAWGAAICGFEEIELIDTELVSPEGAYLEPDAGDALVVPREDQDIPFEVVLHAQYAATAPLPAATCVSGLVLGMDGQPAANLPVRVAGQVVYTDENGQYSVETYAGKTLVEVADPVMGVYQETTVTPNSEEPYELPDTAPYTPVTLSFDAAGGSGEMAPVEVCPEQLLPLPDCDFAAPDVSMVFDRWDLGAPGDLVRIDADTVATAEWRVEHVHTLVRAEATEPDCESDGSLGAWHCESCGRWFLDETATEELFQTGDVDLTVPALGHDWQLNAWVWSEDNAAATAEFLCARDETHSLSVAATVETVRTVAPENGKDGLTVLRATATLDGAEYMCELSAPIPSGLPQSSLIDTEGHWVDWIWDQDANSLSLTGDLGGEVLTVTSYDASGNVMGVPIELTVLPAEGTTLTPAAEHGAASLEIRWGELSESVTLPLPGDRNGDGAYDTTEALYLLLCAVRGGADYTLDWNEADCDFDGNGSFDAHDALWLLFHQVEFAVPGAVLNRFVIAAYENGQLTGVHLLGASDGFSP